MLRPITRLREKIEAVIKYAPVLDNQQREYRLNPPLADEALRNLQTEYDLVLPDEYTLFVSELGDGGLGPGTGLLSLADAVGECQEHMHSQGSFSISSNHFNEVFPLRDVDALRSKMLDRPLAVQLPVNGFLPLSHLNEPGLFVLGLNGEQSDKIWYVHAEDNENALWYPAGATYQLSFLEWYEDWLDSCLPRYVSGQWSKEEKAAKLSTVSYAVVVPRHTISLVWFLELIRLFPKGIKTLLDAIDAVLADQINREELWMLIQDLDAENPRDGIHTIYRGPRGEIRAQLDTWGRDLTFYVEDYEAFELGFNTAARSTIHERIEDLLEVFGDVYIFNMEEDIEHELLFRMQTANLLYWEAGKPRLKV